jgi:hypothetical protein
MVEARERDLMSVEETDGVRTELLAAVRGTAVVLFGLQLTLIGLFTAGEGILFAAAGVVVSVLGLVAVFLSG